MPIGGGYDLRIIRSKIARGPAILFLKAEIYIQKGLIDFFLLVWILYNTE